MEDISIPSSLWHEQGDEIIVEQQDAWGRPYWIVRDSRTSLLKEMRWSDYVVRFQFDRASNLTELVESTDGFSRTNRWTVDARGRLEAHENPLGAITRYRYNEFDDLIEVIRPDQAALRWNYKPAGVVAAQVDELGRTNRFAHNALSARQR